MNNIFVIHFIYSFYLFKKEIPCEKKDKVPIKIEPEKKEGKKFMIYN